jgi:4a-hydroxytetrahydrobiopterin dehydratase
VNGEAHKVPSPARPDARRRLAGAELAGPLDQLSAAWHIIAEHHLERAFDFPAYRAALDFTLRVGELAEEVDHHPEIVLSYGNVRVRLWTHKVDGLTARDFDLAARIDRLPQALERSA